ncbi:uncharacterized protein ACRADG_005070 [Cochliomyia hominivorax]
MIFKLFDPLELLCPSVTKCKMLLQELWIQKLDWDESIPMRLDTAWNIFKENLLKVVTQVTHFVIYLQHNQRFWADSEINLHLVTTHPASLATFVSYRVAEIQE